MYYSGISPLIGYWQLFLKQMDTRDPANIINEQVAAQKAAETALNKLWTLVLGDGTSNSAIVFDALNNIALFLAVISIVWFGFNWLRKLLESESMDGMASFAKVLFIVLLLANNGSLQKASSFLMRDFINGRSMALMEQVSKNFDLARKMESMATDDTQKQELTAAIQDCRANLASRPNCLDDIRKKMDELRAANSPLSRQTWFDSLRDKVGDTIGKIATDPLGAAADFTKTVIPAALDTMSIGYIIILKAILMAMAFGFQMLMDFSMLTTALISPIAVGTALFSENMSSLIAWISAFWSIGLMRIYYNVSVALSASMLLGNGVEGSLPLTHYLVMALFAPILASMLAGGGGLAFYKGAMQATSFVIKTASEVGVAALTGGGSGIGGIIKSMQARRS
jgi:hypothetical protein